MLERKLNPWSGVGSLLLVIAVSTGCGRQQQQLPVTDEGALSATTSSSGIQPPTYDQPTFGLEEAATTPPPDYTKWPGGDGVWANTKSGGQQRYVNGVWETKGSASSEVGATWSGGPGSWTPSKVFQGNDTGTTVFTDPGAGAYKDGKWTNWSGVSTGLGTQYKNAQAGTALGSGYQQVQGLGNGLFGVPTGQKDMFAAVNGRFDPTVRTTNFQASDNSAAIFQKTGTGFQPAGRYDFQGNPTNAFNNWSSQFTGAQLGNYGAVPQNQWGNLGALFAGLFGD